jgi:hypothetical protein
MYANKIKTPILLIHGEVDDNSGTFPIQSDRMYQAIRGNGGTPAGFLPAEGQGYRAKETIETYSGRSCPGLISTSRIHRVGPRATTTNSLPQPRCVVRLFPGHGPHRSRLQ